MKTQLKLLLAGLILPTLIFSQAKSTNQQQNEYSKEIDKSISNIRYRYERITNSIAKAYESGFSESLLKEHINYCTDIKASSEVLSKEFKTALQDVSLKLQVKDLYKVMNVENNKLVIAVEKYKNEATKMIEKNCFKENDGCNFSIFRDSLISCYVSISDSENSIYFNNLLIFKLSQSTTFKYQTIEDIFSPKEKLRTFKLDGYELNFYDAIFPEDEFTFKWSGGGTTIDGKTYLNGTGKLEFIQDGYPVCTYEGNINNGRFMDVYAIMTYTNFKGPRIDNQLRMALHFKIEALFYNKPVGELKISSKYGEYIGESINFIPHGKGKLDSPHYYCNGEFKGGLPFSVDCEPKYGSDKKPFKIVNGKEQ